MSLSGSPTAVMIVPAASSQQMGRDSVARCYSAMGSVITLSVPLLFRLGGQVDIFPTTSMIRLLLQRYICGSKTASSWFSVLHSPLLEIDCRQLDRHAGYMYIGLTLAYNIREAAAIPMTSLAAVAR